MEYSIAEKKVNLTEKENIIHYNGVLDYHTIGILLKKLSRLMDQYTWSLSTKKKVYCAMVESLENIDKHHDSFEGQDFTESKFTSMCKLYQDDEKIKLDAGNIIANKNIEKLQSHLDHINNLDEAELKELYKKTITSGELSEKGGAGLGIINMAKASKNKIEYSFEPIDEDFSYFKIKVTVNAV